MVDLGVGVCLWLPLTFFLKFGYFRNLPGDSSDSDVFLVRGGLLELFLFL